MTINNTTRAVGLFGNGTLMSDNSEFYRFKYICRQPVHLEKKNQISTVPGLTCYLEVERQHSDILM